MIIFYLASEYNSLILKDEKTNTTYSNLLSFYYLGIFLGRSSNNFIQIKYLSLMNGILLLLFSFFISLFVFKIHLGHYY